MGYDALGQWDGKDDGPKIDPRWYQMTWGDGSYIWTGAPEDTPLNTPADGTNATKIGASMSAKQVQAEFDALPAAEKAAYKARGVDPVAYYNANGRPIPAGNLSNTLQWQGAIENTPSFKGEGQGGLGSLLGMMGSDLGPFIAASLAAAGATGGLGGLFGGASSGGGFGSGFIDAIGSGVGAGSPITGALGTAGATAGGSGMDWIDVLGDWATGGETASQSVVDLFNNAGMPGYSNYGQSLEDMAAQLFDQAGMPGFDQYGNTATGWDLIKSYLPSGMDMSSVKDAASLKSLLGLDGKTIGSLLSSGFGAYASNKQTNALEEQAKRYESYGAPYRQKLSDLYKDPTSFLSSPEVRVPVDQGTSSLMRSLSTQGNPFGSGNALQQGQSYASDQLFGKLGQEKDRLAGFGGLSSYNQAAPQASTNAINSSSNAWNAVGAGANNIFNPPQTQAQTMAEWMKVIRP